MCQPLSGSLVHKKQLHDSHNANVYYRIVQVGTSNKIMCVGRAEIFSRYVIKKSSILGSPCDQFRQAYKESALREHLSIRRIIFLIYLFDCHFRIISFRIFHYLSPFPQFSFYSSVPSEYITREFGCIPEGC